MAILRAVGASPGTVIGLLMIEAGLLSFFGVLLGIALLYVLVSMLHVRSSTPTTGSICPSAPCRRGSWSCLQQLLAPDLQSPFSPALRAYEMSLADGMTVRV